MTGRRDDPCGYGQGKEMSKKACSVGRTQQEYPDLQVISFQPHAEQTCLLNTMNENPAMLCIPF